MMMDGLQINRDTVMVSAIVGAEADLARNTRGRNSVSSLRTKTIYENLERALLLISSNLYELN